MDKRKARVKEVTLQTIEEQGSFTTTDVSHRIKEIHPSAVSQFIRHNYEEWGLTREIHQGGWVYTKLPVISLPKKMAKRIDLIVEKDKRYETRDQLVEEVVDDYLRKLETESLPVEQALYKIIEERRKKEREMIKELTFKIIDGEITVEHPEGFVTTKDILGIMGIKNISRQSIAAYLKMNYERWELVRGDYSKNLATRRYAYARDRKNIQPYPHKKPIFIKTREEEKKLPERVEKMIEHARQIQKPKTAPIFLTTSKYQPREGEGLDNWLMRIHDQPRSFNKIVDLADKVFDKSELSLNVRELVNKNKLVFEDGKTHRKDL